MARRPFPTPAGHVRLELKPEAELALESFRNMLSWGVPPVGARDGARNLGREHWPVPPAWWAYVLGATRWCPPRGEW